MCDNMITNIHDKYNNAVDLLITLAISEVLPDAGTTATEMLPKFLASRTAHILYDESTKLWWDGPSAIAEMYREEMKVKGELV